MSAVSGDQVQLLADLLVGLLPEGPPLYPDGDLTDAPEEALAADLIREAALEGVRDELPHSIAVVVEEMGLREGRPADKPLLDIVANLYVERDFAVETAATIRGLRTWETDEFEHNGLRADGERVLGRLIDLARGRA